VITPSGEDSFSPFDDLLAGSLSSPWGPGKSYEPDHALLEELLAVPVAQGVSSQSGRFPRALDAWIAQELRRAGLGEDEVWPRRIRPRVLSPALAKLQRQLEPPVPAPVRQLLKGSVDARLFGEFYVKQVDVAVAEWDRGAELLVSTKSQLSSFGNNQKNRFEEAVGDLRNLRGRYPLAALGFAYLVRSTILDEGGQWEFAQDMTRKLRLEDRGYDATVLLVAEWDDDWEEDEDPEVEVVTDVVPEELGTEQFFTNLLVGLLERTPAAFHVRARELMTGKASPLEEGVEPVEDP